MKKRGFSRILALALCLGLLTPYGYAAQERPSGAEYAAQQARANVITLSHLGDLRSAVQNANDGDVIILEGFGNVNALNDLGDDPWVIVKALP